MNTNTALLLARLEDAADGGRDSEFSELAFEIESDLMTTPRAIETWLLGVEKLLSKPSFRLSRNSWKILTSLRHDVQRASVEMQKRFLETLLATLYQPSDPMFRFTSTEVVGRFSPEAIDSRLLIPLLLPNGLCDPIVPHAVEHLARATSGRERETFLKLLEELSTSENDDVQAEAELSKGRLARAKEMGR